MYWFSDQSSLKYIYSTLYNEEEIYVQKNSKKLLIWVYKNKLDNPIREFYSSLQVLKWEFIQKGIPEKNIWVKIMSAANKIEEWRIFIILLITNWK